MPTGLKVSFHRGRLEVTGGWSERRDLHFPDLVWATGRFAEAEADIQASSFRTKAVSNYRF
jgi:hypothetical protein